MNDNLNDVLATLALRLGTTVPHLYQVVVDQAMTETIGNLTTQLVALGLMVWAKRGIIRSKEIIKRFHWLCGTSC